MSADTQKPTLSDVRALLVLYAAKWRRGKLAQSDAAGREEFYEKFFEKSDEEVYLRDRRMQVRRRTIDSALSRHVLPGARILDVGCGLGDVLAGIGSKYVRCGIDFSHRNVRWASRRFGDEAVISQGSAYSIPYGDGEFDAVICLEVLEHLEDDGKAIAELSRVLKRGGILIASVPSSYYWPAYRRLIGHLRHYSRQSFADLLDAGHLRILEDLPHYPEWHRRYMRGYLRLRTMSLVLKAIGINRSPYELKMPWRTEPEVDRLERRLVPILDAESRLDYAGMRTSTFVVAGKA